MLGVDRSIIASKLYFELETCWFNSSYFFCLSFPFQFDTLLSILSVVFWNKNKI